MGGSWQRCCASTRRPLCRWGVAATVLCLATMRAPAQPPQQGKDIAAVSASRGALPEFEVATIKPISPGGMHMVGAKVLPGGTVKIQTFSVRDLICTAFDLSGWQVAGLDPKTDKESYDVEAKPPEAPTALPYVTRSTLFGIADERLRQMLQALLIDRFQLKFHRQVETGAIYLLERNEKALPKKLTQTTASSPYPSGNVAAVSGKGWGLYDTSMKELAHFLSTYVVHRPVLDQTGVEGAFDFHSQLILTDEDFRNPDFMETLLPVLPEMGLKLQSSKGEVEKFVVDHVEAPSPN